MPLNTYFNDYFIGISDEPVLSERDDIDLENRVDILCKIVYLQSLNHLCPKDIGLNCYRKHILALNGGKGKDSPHKEGIDDYIREFNSLYHSILQKFDQTKSAIPIALDKTLIDGSHRVSILLNEERKIPLIKTHIASAPKQPISTLSNRYKLTATERLWVIRSFIRFSPSTRLLFYFPARDKSKDISASHLCSLYFKELCSLKIKIKDNLFGQNVFKLLYSGCEWIGSHDNKFKGAKWKQFATQSLGDTNINMRIIQSYNSGFTSIKNLKHFKEKMRDYYQIRFHSLHTTDSIEENIRFYDMTILSNHLALGFCKGFELTKILLTEAQLKFLDSLLELSLYKRERILISGGMSMALLGIRSTNDIDLVSAFKLSQGLDHMPFLKKYLPNHSLDDLLGNPQNYIWLSCQGKIIKVISPILMLKLKKNLVKYKRCVKSQEDIALLQTFFPTL